MCHTGLMCGRFTLFTDDQDLVTLFDVDVMEGEHAPAFNQAPSQLIRSVVGDEPRSLTLQRWGLVPGWAKAGFKPLINARAETVTEKPSFRAAASRRRCLLPTNGYYEWSDKQPFFLGAAGKEGHPVAPLESPVLAMAGIYEVPWSDIDTIATCAVVTREATDSLGHIHPRMPLFVPEQLWEEWLDPTLTDGESVAALIDSLPETLLAAQPVSKAVGNVRVQDPEVIFSPTTLF